MEEQLLIAGCKRGESWAQKQIYLLHAPIMMSLCMRYINNKETAQDLVQDGFIIIYTKIHSYTEIGSFGGWMRRIFINIILEHLRKNDALKFSVNIDEYNDATGNFDTGILDQLSADELMECIAGLPKGFKTVFNLYAIEGYSHEEIATMLHIKESTSRSQFMRARKFLQKHVQSQIIQENARRVKS